MTFACTFVRAGGDDPNDFWNAVTCHRLGIVEKWHGRPAREITRKMRVPILPRYQVESVWRGDVRLVYNPLSLIFRSALIADLSLKNCPIGGWYVRSQMSNPVCGRP
jgi:hypothetical protein